MRNNSFQRGLTSFHHRLIELERRLVGGSTIITTRSGKIRITDKDAPRLMLESWHAISRTYSLDAGELSRVGISDQLEAVADCSESNPDWPNALQHAHDAITERGKYIGRDAVMQFLRTKKENR
jgi:hypothetical protein